MDVAGQLVSLLTEQRLLLALAESCTGGLLAGRITAVPGASAMFLGGVVAYDNRAKSSMLDVPQGLLRDFGAVSAETAEAMVAGALRRFGAHLAASTTGVAGPDGGTPGKPVGRVYVAVGSPRGTVVRRCDFVGDREDVRRQACDVALEMLLSHALKPPKWRSVPG